MFIKYTIPYSRYYYLTESYWCSSDRKHHTKLYKELGNMRKNRQENINKHRKQEREIQEIKEELLEMKKILEIIKNKILSD